MDDDFTADNISYESDDESNYGVKDELPYPTGLKSQGKRANLDVLSAQGSTGGASNEEAADSVAPVMEVIGQRKYGHTSEKGPSLA